MKALNACGFIVHHACVPPLSWSQVALLDVSYFNGQLIIHYLVVRNCDFEGWISEVSVRDVGNCG